MADKVSADFPETGWGMPFASFFNEAVEVQNHAYNGRSTKSFRREGRWAKVFNQIKKGIMYSFSLAIMMPKPPTRAVTPQLKLISAKTSFAMCAKRVQKVEYPFY